MSNAFCWRVVYLGCMQSLNRLRHIVAVARSRSFSIAAEDVGISQPALSRSIQAFEEQYGVRLFDRGRGGVALTPAGKLAVEKARMLLDDANEFDRQMHLFGRGHAGRTGLGMGPLMASLLLPHLGKALLQRSPGLTFLARVAAPDQMLEALLEGAIELIVGNSWQLGPMPGVAEERLGALELAIVVRAEHPLSGARILTMQDLDDFPTARAFDHSVDSQTSSSGAFICEDFSILREVVLDTDCTWLVSPAFIKSELEQGRLVKLRITDLPTPETPTSLVYLRGRTRSPASVILADSIRLIVRDMEILV